MKELDFLPEWYKDDKRRQVGMHRQYVALVVVFLLMISFNATAIHRAGKAAAEGARLENQRMGAEAVVNEFNVLTRQLNDLKGRAGLIEQIDSRVDMAALMAELSHLISDTITLRKMEVQMEPFTQSPGKGAVVRLAGGPANAEKATPLGRARFRIVLAGVATHPAAVADLVCRLEASAYFQRVHPSFYGSAKGAVGAKATLGPQGGGSPKVQSASEWTEFEITCYLANYKETDE